MTRWYRLYVWGLALLLSLLILPGQVSAHAHLIQADLAPNGHFSVPAGTYRFWFDESLNGALSKIIIRNSAGTQVNTDTGTVNSANGEEIDVRLPALPAGQYSVFWTSDSTQDGHILHGFYVFTAGGAGAKAVSTSEPAGVIADNAPQLDSTSLTGALAHWLVLIAATIWTGALALEILVLAPARSGARRSSIDLAERSSSYIVMVVRYGAIASLVTNVIELEVQAYGAGGWSGMVSGSVLQGTLHSHYGTYWILRMVTSFLALLVAGLAPVQKPVAAVIGVGRRGTGTIAQAGWTSKRPFSIPVAGILGFLGLLYLLEIALSGHAAAVSQLVFTSVLLDWLHLIANSVWIGGMGAIALALIPVLLRPVATTPTELHGRRQTFLTLLDCYSPAAFIAVATAAVTGMFNAQVHLDSLSQLFDSTYGRFLVIKLACIGELMLLSASHVFLARPKLRAMPLALVNTPQAEEGYASLTARLRVEPLIGVLILLCVALMGQVAPSVMVFSQPTTTSSASNQSSPSTSTPTSSVPTSINATVHKGNLTVNLTIAPPAVGQATFTTVVHENGKLVTKDNGQVRVKLSVPSKPSVGHVFVETTPKNGGYVGKGDLALDGHWRADVMVRTRDDPTEFRDVPFDFEIGLSTAFLEAAPAATGYGPATVQLKVRESGPSTLKVKLRPGLTVRYEVLMLGMPGMGTADYPATPSGNGSYTGDLLFEMQGATSVLIQVRSGSAWKIVRDLIYDIDAAGKATLVTASKVTTPAPTTKASTQAYNLNFARHLPYEALVTRMHNNTVATLQGVTMKLGPEPHGVDVIDGTDLAYVTDFLGGDVRVINWKTMKVLHRIPVSLEPAHVVFTPDHTRAFVTNFLSNDVSVIDMHTYKVIGDITVGLRPHGIDLSPDGRIVYVACGGAGSIYAIDTHTLKIIAQAPSGLGPIGLTVNPANGDINVTDSVGDEVYILKPGSLDTIATIKVGRQPALMTITDDGSRLYVANQLGNTVSVINTHTHKVIGTVPVGNGPHGPDITPDNKYVYVPAINSGTISFIRTSDNKVVGVIPVGEGPNEVAINR